jgi:hypothetical protein
MEQALNTLLNPTILGGLLGITVLGAFCYGIYAGYSEKREEPSDNRGLSKGQEIEKWDTAQKDNDIRSETSNLLQVIDNTNEMLEEKIELIEYKIDTLKAKLSFAEDMDSELRKNAQEVIGLAEDLLNNTNKTKRTIPNITTYNPDWVGEIEILENTKKYQREYNESLIKIDQFEDFLLRTDI